RIAITTVLKSDSGRDFEKTEGRRQKAEGKKHAKSRGQKATDFEWFLLTRPCPLLTVFLPFAFCLLPPVSLGTACAGRRLRTSSGCFGRSSARRNATRCFSRRRVSGAGAHQSRRRVQRSRGAPVVAGLVCVRSRGERAHRSDRNSAWHAWISNSN